MDTTTIAHPAPRPTREKPRRTCAACGEPSSGISARIGFPVVGERATGCYYHVRCRPGSRPATAAILLSVAL